MGFFLPGEPDFFFEAPLVSSNFLGELFLKPSAFFNLVRFFGSGKSFNLAIISLFSQNRKYLFTGMLVSRRQPMK